ncbi:MAG: histidine phosphatase family protein [Myxococcales bacterium]|nr:histidine phosphatase family protein [Myxococcales bacterium]
MNGILRARLGQNLKFRLWHDFSVLILVRHGRTNANKDGRLQGRLDLDLDSHGRRQAVAVAAMVAGRGPVEVVHYCFCELASA